MSHSVTPVPASCPRGLAAVRADLEEHARSGPFAVDAGAALEALSVDYGEDFTLGHDGKWFWAWRDGGEEVVVAATPDELVAAMRARWGTSGESPAGGSR